MYYLLYFKDNSSPLPAYYAKQVVVRVLPFQIELLVIFIFSGNNKQ